MLLSWREVWRGRVNDSRNVPIIQLCGMFSTSNMARFRLVDGYQDINISDRNNSYEWIIVRDVDEMAEGMFDDLKIGLKKFHHKWVEKEWLNMPKVITDNIAIVKPVKFERTQYESIIEMRVFQPSSASFELTPGQLFRLLPRFTDYDTLGIVKTLLRIDFESQDKESLFLHLLENPNEVGNEPVSMQVDNLMTEEARIIKIYEQLPASGNDDDAPLVFHPSQHPVMHSILKRRVTFVWGPSRRVKTHTLALSIVYLFEILYRLNFSAKVDICLTAVTDAAIDVLVERLKSLKKRITKISKSDTDPEAKWIDELSILRLRNSKFKRPNTDLVFVAGTVPQCRDHLPTGFSADAVFIDEADHMGVGTAAIVLHLIGESTRIIGNFHFMPCN